MFKVAICPRLTWDLATSDLPTSWLQNQLQPIATRLLKRWSGLAKSADPNRLFLPKANGGLELPHLVTVYKKIHTAKAGSHMYSGDSAVRAIAPQNTLHELQLHRALFRPHQEVVGVMKEDPSASKKWVIAQVKAKIYSEDTAARLAHTTSLTVQGLTVREFEGRAAQNWTTAISTLPEWYFKFAPQCGHRHSSTQCQPLQVEEAVLTTVSTLWGVSISGPCPKLLPEGPCPEALHLQA